MELKEFRTTGKIDSEGNLLIYNENAMNVFSRKNKSSDIVLEIHIIGDKASQSMVGYFKKYVVPEFRMALIRNGDYKTLQQTEKFISELSPLLCKEEWDDDAKTWIKDFIKFEDLSIINGMMVLSDLKKIAALEYGFTIEDDWTQ